MTTSDKITHAVDVVFLLGIAALTYFFVQADRQHEQELSKQAGMIQLLEGRLAALEAKAGKPDTTQPGR